MQGMNLTRDKVRVTVSAGGRVRVNLRVRGISFVLCIICLCTICVPVIRIPCIAKWTENDVTVRHFETLES